MSSSKKCRTSSRSQAVPHNSAPHLGDLIRAARNFDGRPLSELAPLVGATEEDWLAIEQGAAAEYCREYFLLMATVLGYGSKWLGYILRLHKEAIAFKESHE